MIQNAFILFKDYHNKDKSYSSLDFIEQLLTEITEADADFDADSEVDADERPQRKHRRHYWAEGDGSKIRLSGREHWPKDARHTFLTIHPETNKASDLRRYCMWHPKTCGRTYTYCSCCKVPLCLSHFEVFHKADASSFPE
jgi:hypothetical protein